MTVSIVYANAYQVGAQDEVLREEGHTLHTISASASLTRCFCSLHFLITDMLRTTEKCSLVVSIGKQPIVSGSCRNAYSTPALESVLRSQQNRFMIISHNSAKSTSVLLCAIVPPDGLVDLVS
jgi:hypothetical protein